MPFKPAHVAGFFLYFWVFCVDLAGNFAQQVNQRIEFRRPHKWLFRKPALVGFERTE
jgi:hypothetical protein